MQARDGRERACSERDGCELSARGGGESCAKRVWARSAYRLGRCPGSGAARVAAVPERSGPIGLARVRERAGADDVWSGAQRRRHAVKAEKTGTRALQNNARASTRGFGAALVRLSGWSGCTVGCAPRERRGGAWRIPLYGGAGVPRSKSRGAIESLSWSASKAVLLPMCYLTFLGVIG